MSLGRSYTAAPNYAFYRTLRIVAVKRHKNSTPHTPGYGRKFTGLTGGPLQASKMKSGLISDATTKKYLVEDFCKAAGFVDNTVTPDLVDAAVRHMHKILLCDLNPLGGLRIPPRLCQGIVC